MIDDREDAEQAALNARLQRLDAALRKVEEEKAAQETPPPARKGFSHAMRVGLNDLQRPGQMPVQAALVLWAVHRFATAPLTPVEQVGLLLSVGTVTGGIGITYAHELVHRSGRFELALGDVLLEQCHARDLQ